MSDQEYTQAIKQLRDDWGSVAVDPNSLGIIRAANDPSAGLVVGARARLFAEIINRALQR